MRDHTGRLLTRGPWVMLGVGVLPILLSIPFVATPLGRDQGYFAYGGWRILHGELPYRDFWSNTFPAVFWWYALMELLHLPRALGNGLVIGATAVLLSVVGRTAWIGLVYGVTAPLLHRFWDMGQAESLVNLFAAASLASPSPFFSGVLMGWAILSKPVGALFLLLLGRPWKPKLAGLALALIVALVPYAEGKGISRLREDLLSFNLGYASSTLDPRLFDRAARAMLRWAVPLWPALCMAIVGAHGHTALAWLGLALAAVIGQGKLFSYHWVLPLAPVALGAGQGLARLRRLTPLAIAALVCASVGPWCIRPDLVSRAWYPAAVDVSRGLSYLTGHFERETYLSFFGFKQEGATFSALDQDRAATVLRARGYRTALVWGFEPGLNYLSRLPCPLRYIADFPLTFPARSARARRLRDLHRERFIVELHETMPDCIVVVHDDANPVEPIDSAQQMREFSAFEAFLTEWYEGPTRVGTYSLWVRR